MANLQRLAMFRRIDGVIDHSIWQSLIAVAAPRTESNTRGFETAQLGAPHRSSASRGNVMAIWLAF